MIRKTNLFTRNTPEESLSEGIIQIIPRIPHSIILYEYERELNCGVEFSNKPIEIDREILYFLSGNGIIRIDSEEETVLRGDRIIISNNCSYLISNTGGTKLHFLQIGIITK